MAGTHRAAIKDSDVLVIVLSPDSVASQEVRRELASADRERKPVIPVALRPVEVPDASSYLMDVSFLPKAR